MTDESTRDEDALADELSRNLNQRQSRKIRKHPHNSESRAVFFARPQSAVEVYGSGVRNDPLWGVWARGGTYIDDRSFPIATLGTLFARHEPRVVDVDELPGSVRRVFERRCQR